jgi:hypothetical protein
MRAKREVERPRWHLRADFTFQPDRAKAVDLPSGGLRFAGSGLSTSMRDEPP